MRNNHLSRWLYFVFIISLLMLSMIDGKGFGGSRGGGGARVSGSKGSGTFGGSSGYNRPSGYGSNVGRSHSGSKLGSFAAGAAGGVAAYAVMRSLSGSHYSRPGGYYGEGYGGGQTCTNNEDLNGTTFGQFRCPMYGFPYEATACCGEYGKQYCCIPERSSRFSRSSAHFGWIVLLIIGLLIGILFWARRNRQRQKEVLMVPTEPPPNEQYQPPPFYQPPPPPSGYPPPPGGYPPQGGNPYGPPPGSYNPYGQPTHMPYPPQQQQYNPY